MILLSKNMGVNEAWQTNKSKETDFTSVFMAIAFEIAVFLTNCKYFFRLQDNAAIKTCLFANSMPLVLIRFIFRKWSNVLNTGSTHIQKMEQLWKSAIGTFVVHTLYYLLVFCACGRSILYECCGIFS